jgi:hypothetical protein
MSLDFLITLIKDNIVFIIIFILFVDFIGIRFLSYLIHCNQAADNNRTCDDIEKSIKNFFNNIFGVMMVCTFALFGYLIYDAEQNQNQQIMSEAIDSYETDYNFDCGKNPEHKNCQ